MTTNSTNDAPERFALSSWCDNTGHSRCPYPDRCTCECHQRVHQQSDGEPSLEDLAIQAADYLQKLDDEQAGYISFALRQKMADTRAHAPVVDDGRRQGLQEALRIAKTVNCVEGYMPERAMIELAIEHALALLDKKEG